MAAPGRGLWRQDRCPQAGEEDMGILGPPTPSLPCTLQQALSFSLGSSLPGTVDSIFCCSSPRPEQVPQLKSFTVILIAPTHWSSTTLPPCPPSLATSARKDHPEFLHPDLTPSLVGTWALSLLQLCLRRLILPSELGHHRLRQQERTSHHGNKMMVRT